MEYFCNLLSNYSPFSSLLQYVFHRLMGKYLKHDISMSNFALGTCMLKNLELASEKINENMLKSSPFALYQGHIGKFNLKIPWTNILQDSIAITVEDLELWLFCKENSEAFVEQKCEFGDKTVVVEEFEEEDKELYDTKVDVFKRIVNKILLNMTIDIKSIRVRVFHNETALKTYFSHKMMKSSALGAFSKQNSLLSEHALLLKIGSFSVKKQQNDTKSLEKTSIFLDGIENFYLEIKEISGHILEQSGEERADFFENTLNKKLASFHYPNISHPSTFVALSTGISLHFQKRKNSNEISKLKLVVDKGEITLSPRQISFLWLVAEKINCLENERNANNLANPDLRSKSRENLTEPPLLQRNRSFSLDGDLKQSKDFSKKSPALVKKSSALLENQEEKPKHEESLLLKSRHLGANLLKSVSKRKHEAENTDLLKVVIQDYFEKAENQEFSVHLFEKPAISALSEDKRAVSQAQTSAQNISLEEESRMLNKAELLLDLADNCKENAQNPSISVPNNAKIELSITRFHVNVLETSALGNPQEFSGRPWLFSGDPLVETPKKTHSKYQLLFNCPSFQLILSKVALSGRTGQDFQGKVEKIRLISAQIQEIPARNLEESEIFHSVASSLKASCFDARKFERRLDFFDVKRGFVRIKEVFRLDCGEAGKSQEEVKRKQGKVGENLGFCVERIPVYEEFAVKDRRIEKNCASFALKKQENSLKVAINPLVLALNLEILKRLRAIAKEIQRNLEKDGSFVAKRKEIDQSMTFPLNLSASKHHRAKKPVEMPQICVNLHGIYVNFERKLHFFVDELNFITIPLTVSFKLSFESFRIAFEKFLVARIFGKIVEKSAVFFQKERKVQANGEKVPENADISAKNCETLMKNKPLVGVFLRNAQFYAFREIVAGLSQFSEEIARGFHEIFEENAEDFPAESEEFDEKAQKNSEEMQRNAGKPAPKLFFSLVIEELEIFVNESIFPQDFQESLVFTVFGLQFLAVSGESQRNSQFFWLALEEIYVFDGKAQEIQLDCPLKLVQGVSSASLKKSIENDAFFKRFQGKPVENRLQGLILYKQACFLREKAKENCEFFADFRVISHKNACFRAFFQQSPRKLDFELKGLVFRPDFSLSFAKRLENILTALKNPQAQENPAKARDFVDGEVSGLINSLCLDFFPYYSPADIARTPDIFHLRSEDLDFSKQGLFFSTTRSVLLVNGLQISGFRGGNGDLRLDLRLKSAKLCLVQYFDLFVETNPLLLLDFCAEITGFYDSLLENLGFMPIFEVSQLKLLVAENREFRVDCALISLDFCRDSLRVLPRHVKNVLLNVNCEESHEKSQGKPGNRQNIEKNPRFAGKVKRKSSFVLIDEDELLKLEAKERDFRAETREFLKQSAKNAGFQAETPEFVVNVQSLGVKLYEGADFDFEIKRNTGVSAEKRKENASFQGNREEMVIVSDYFGSKSKKPATNRPTQGKNRRFRNSARNFQRFVSFSVEELDFSLRSRENCKEMALFVGKFEVIDGINTSKINKMLTVFEETPDFPGFLRAKLSFWRFDAENSIEMSVFARLQSVRIFLNGVNTQFLLAFVQNELSAEDESFLLTNELIGQNFQRKREFSPDFAQNARKIDVFSSHPNIFSGKVQPNAISEEFPRENSENSEKRVKINVFFFEKFEVSIDYDATYSHLNMVLENSLNLLNIGNIRDLRLVFKEIFLMDEALEPEFFAKIADFWKNDVISNQKPKILTKLPYISNLFRIFEAFANIFYVPVRELRAGNSLERGVFQGMSSFFKAISVEGLNFTEIVGESLGFGLKKLGISFSRQKRNFLPRLLEKAREIVDPDEFSKKDEKYKRKLL